MQGRRVEEGQGNMQQPVDLCLGLMCSVCRDGEGAKREDKPLVGKKGMEGSQGAGQPVALKQPVLLSAYPSRRLARRL